MTESVKSITQHHEPLRIFIAAESADETGKMARTFCDASDIVVTGSATMSEASQNVRAIL